MTIPKIYLETTMFSFYDEERQEARYQELRDQTRQVFDLIKAGKYEPFTSAYATDEMEGEPDIEKRENMKGLIRDYGIKLTGGYRRSEAACGPLHSRGGYACGVSRRWRATSFKNPYYSGTCLGRGKQVEITEEDIA
jgi:hypothetical protein